MNLPCLSMAELIQRFREELSSLYPEREIRSIVHLLTEQLNYKKTDLYLYPSPDIPPDHQAWLFESLEKLKKNMPVQYIIGHTWFCDLKIKLGEGVLIPRPETEELVYWILSEHSGDKKKVLDIACGSGCIALAVKKQRPGWELAGMDVEERALDISRKNAAGLGLEVDWFRGDMRETSLPFSPASIDILVSNPPYIPEDEMDSIPPNVLLYEPSVALFVPREDPLLFYRSLEEIGRKYLSAGGTAYFELHEKYAEGLRAFFVQNGWLDVEVRKDIHGRERMLRVRKNS